MPSIWKTSSWGNMVEVKKFLCYCSLVTSRMLATPCQTDKCFRGEKCSYHHSMINDEMMEAWQSKKEELAAEFPYLLGNVCKHNWWTAWGNKHKLPWLSANIGSWGTGFLSASEQGTKMAFPKHPRDIFWEAGTSLLWPWCWMAVWVSGQCCGINWPWWGILQDPECNPVYFEDGKWNGQIIIHDDTAQSMGWL